MLLKKYMIFLFVFIVISFPFPVFAFSDTAKSSIVMDVDSGRILYQKNANEKRLIASITKIMTAVVALEEGDLDRKITVGEEVLAMYGTNIYIEVGEKMVLRDLIYGLLMRSGNDAAVVIAKAVAGSEEKFVELMNQKAKKIGMKNTIFMNPHGLDEDTENYSSAYDMALLSQYASKNKLYQKIVSTNKYEVSTGKKTYLWYNRNKLLTTYEYCTGGKNGYTPRAGKTLVTTASKQGLNLTVVTLSDGDIYGNHKKLYEEYFKQYKKYKIVDKNHFSIDKEFVDEDIYLKESFYYPLKESEVEQVKTIVSFINHPSTSVIGKIQIYLNEDKIGSIDIYKQEKKKVHYSFFQKIINLFRR